MRHLRILFWATTVSAVILQVGCQRALDTEFRSPTDLRYYRDFATSIDYPDVQTNRLSEVEKTLNPRTLSDPGTQDYWDLSLEEAIRLAMENSKVIRDLGGRVLNSPTAAQSTYQPALQESDPRFGVEGVLSAFDAQYSTGIFWQKTDRPRNVAPAFLGLFPGQFVQESATFQSGLSKRAASGGTWSLGHRVEYDGNNSPTNLFPSAYTTSVEASVTQPFLQGAGVQFNRIAGPNASPGFYNGVIIARVNNDIALTDFEASVRGLVSDVENAYWDLYFAYRDLDAKIAGRDSALQTWRRIYALYRTGGKGGEADKEAQAREQYFFFRAQVENALAGVAGQSTLSGAGSGAGAFRAAGGVYARENNLRFLMGLTANDGRLIRPQDEPSAAKVAFDWDEVLNEALCRRVELRRQRWVIKRREMELLASKNFLMPRLDGVATYRWVGFGDQLYADQGPTGFESAYGNLGDGNNQEWVLGLQYTMPVGFRQAMTGVRNAQLQLARERAVMEDQELQVSHDLSHAIRELDRAFQLVQTNFNRRVAAARQVEAVRASYEANAITLDVLLDSQRRLADADTAYYRSLVEYNLAIKGVHFEKGSLLDYNTVRLAEGPWPCKAYQDATYRASRRKPEIGLDYSFNRPGPVSRGQYGLPSASEGEFIESEGVPFQWEEQMVPTLEEDASPNLLPAPGTAKAQPMQSASNPGFSWGPLGIASSTPNPSPTTAKAAGSPVGRGDANLGNAIQQAQYQETQTGPQLTAPNGQVQPEHSEGATTHRVARPATGWKRAQR